MKKNFLQDVVPPNHKRSLRDIPLPRNQTLKQKSTTAYSFQDTKEQETIIHTEDTNEYTDASFQKKDDLYESTNKEHEEVEHPRYTKHKKTGNTFIKKIFFTALTATLITIFVMISRTTAEVTITQKQGSYDVNTSIPIDASSTLATQTQITKSATLTVQATSEQQVSDKASGKIKIINNDSSTPQDLIKNTRFQTPEGLVYRIKDAIKIPGYTQSGSTIIPGTLEVDVYADESGEKYNIGKTKFTIPGFNGTPQFSSITAESVTEMKGGYVGIKKVISDADKKKAESDLQIQAKNQFTAQAIESDSYIIIPDISKIKFSDIKDEVQGSSIILTLDASTEAFSFKKQDLFNYIGQSTIIGATKSDAFSLKVQDLQFSIDTGVLNAKGTTDIQWITDTNALKQDLAGKKKSEVLQIFNSYRSFEKGTSSIRPFWKTRFPNSVDKINIIINE